MTLAVIGSRNFPPAQRNKVLSLLGRFYNKYRPTHFVSGGARGVDSWSEEFAKSKGLELDIIKPDWDKFGKRAGFLRNSDIVAKADFVIAFTTGSNGTQDSIDKAIKSGKAVIAFESRCEFLYKYNWPEDDHSVGESYYYAANGGDD